MRLRTSTKEDIFSEIKNKFDRWKMFKLPFEGNMFLNLAFYYGYQWSFYNLAMGELSEIDNPAGRIRVTSNQIQPRVRNLLAKMTKNRPIEEVVPDDWTEEALFSASVSRALLRRWRETMNEDELDKATALWMLTIADCFRKIGFDPDEGPKQKYDKIEEFMEYAGFNPETGLSEMQGIGFRPNTEENFVEYNTGEIFDDVVPAFEVFLPEYATDMKSTRELLHVKLMPISEIKTKWGRRAANVNKVDKVDLSSSFQQRLLGMASPEIGAMSGISKIIRAAAEELTYVYEYWKKPCRDYPNGLLAICAGTDAKGVLYAEDNPYLKAFEDIEPLKELEGIAWVHFGCIEAPGRFWNISPIEPMRPLQVEYNKTITDIVQNRATVGRNKILAPKTARIDRREFANIHGQLIEYHGIKEPNILPAVPLPVQVERETERNRQDMDTISGSHEVSRAEAPSGVKSGIAINYLLEQDDTTFAPIIRNFEFGKRKVAIMKLAIARYFYSDVRLIKSAETEGPADIMAFRSEDITANIRIVPGSAMPQSRAALQATYMDLFGLGAIIDDQGRPDPIKLFNLLKHTMPIEAMSEEETLDISRAKRENMLLMNGTEVLPQPWENQIIHIAEHNKFRKTERFYKLSEYIKKNFEMHITIHMDMAAPPTATPGAEEMLAMMQPAGKSNGAAARRSPSVVGQGSMGALNNPPANYGGTVPGGR